MRIALLTSGYLPVLDGVSISVHARVTRLAARGHQVLLLAPAAGAPPALPAGVEFVPVASRRFGAAAGDFNPVPQANAEIDAALGDFQPDLIQVEEPERLAFGLRRLPAIGFGRRHGISVLAFFHTRFVDYWGEGAVWAPLASPLKPIGWHLVAQLYNRFDATLVPSRLSLQRLERAGLTNGVAGVFNGVDTQAFSPALRQPAYWARRWNRPELDRRTVLLIVGRLTADKGWDVWQKALPRLARAFGERLALVIVGDGDRQGQVRALLDVCPGFGHLLGAVPHEELGALLANGDLYATASRHENASLAIYEAQATGLAVIAPAAGGIPDQIRSGETGLLFPPGDVGGLIAAVRRGLEDAETGAAMRRHLAALRPSLDWDRAFETWFAEITARVPDRGGHLPR